MRVLGGPGSGWTAEAGHVPGSQGGEDKPQGGSGKFDKTPRSGSTTRLDDEKEYLNSPKDALNSLVNGEKVYIAKEDVRSLIKLAARRKDDPDLTDVHVDGLQIFGGNGLGIDRADMPQVPKEMRSQF